MGNLDLMVAVWIANAQPYGSTIGGLACGLGVVFALARMADEKSVIAKIGVVMVAAGLAFGPGAWWFFNATLAAAKGVVAENGGPYRLPQQYLNIWIFCAVVGLVLAFFFERRIAPAIEAMLSRVKQGSLLGRSGRTDVRYMEKYIPTKSIEYDPKKYIDIEKGLFVGLDEKKKPIYIPWDMSDESHLGVTGKTRSGKGVALQMHGYQYILRGDLLVMLDPKGDNHMPEIFAEACAAAGKPYHYIDLASPEHQLNIMQGCTEAELRELSFAGFQIEEMGDRADFFKFEQQNQAEMIAEAETKNGPCWSTFAELSNKYNAQILSVPKDAAKGLATKMRQMGRLASVNAKRGPNFAELAETGGCLYIVGSLSDKTIQRAHRMILIRFLQIARRRNFRHGKDHPIRVFADEFATHISNPVLTTLAASAGWGLLLTVAYQGFSDLLRVPMDINPEAFKGSTMNNTRLKMVYSQDDKDARAALAASTGTILVDQETRKIKKNTLQVESMDGDRSVQETERYLVDENMFIALPERCAILLGAHLIPKFCFTWIMNAVPRAQARKINDLAGEDLSLDQIMLPDESTNEEVGMEKKTIDLPE